MGFEAALPSALRHAVSEQRDPSPGLKEILPIMAQASPRRGLKMPRASLIPQFAPCYPDHKAHAGGCCCPGPVGDAGPLERGLNRVSILKDFI